MKQEIIFPLRLETFEANKRGSLLFVEAATITPTKPKSLVSFSADAIG